MKRWEVINKYLERFSKKRYIEIGVRNGECFNKIRTNHKLSVDPDKNSVANVKMTSDKFFELVINNKKFDVIFIDGLHESHQVTKDIKNSLKHLSEGGVIILHDCNPLLEIHAKVPRESKHWNGDVWKAFVKHRTKSYHCTYTIDTDEGLGVIDTLSKATPLMLGDNELNWQNFNSNVRHWH